MTPRAPIPSQRELLALLRYDPESGKLFWRARPTSRFPGGGRCSAVGRANRWNAQYAGTEAFSAITANGKYRKGAIDGRTLMAHRVIFKMLRGYDPVQIDHDNGDGLDNRLCNLFDRTSSQNSRNRAISKANKSGITGVCWAAHVGKWLASIRGENHKIIHLGFFTDLNAAAAARRAAEKRLGYHPNHGRRAA